MKKIKEKFKLPLITVEDVRAYTVLEMLYKLIDKMNGVINMSWNHDERIEELEDNALTKSEYENNITNTRKLDSNANFTGSWFGISSPSYADETIAGVVEQNRNGIGEINNKTLALPNHTPYMNNPNSLYIYHANHIGGIVDFHFENELVVTNKGHITMDQLREKYPNKIATSYEGKKGCIRLSDGESFVYDDKIGDFIIQPFYAFDNRSQIAICYQVAGQIVEGYFKEVMDQNNEWFSNDKYNKIYESQKYSLQGSVQKALDKADPKSHNTTFAFITDIHSQEWNKGYYSGGVSVINKLLKNSVIDFTFNGGDNILWAENKATAMMNLMMTPNRLEGEVYNAVGNHDFNGWDYDKPQPYKDIITNKEMFNICGKGFEDKVTWGSKEGMYYYFDKGDDLRIIVLNPMDIPVKVNDDNTLIYNHVNTFAYSNDQIYWFGNVLLGSTDKHVLVMTHIPLVDHANGMYANFTLAYNGDVIGEMLGHFKEGTPYTFDKTHQDSTFNVSGSVDFTTPSKVVGVLSGHIHYDCDVFKYGYRHIARNCDYSVKWDNTGLSASGGGVPTIPDREVGEWNQYSFDVVTVDTWNRKVYFTKFGAGSDYWYAY